MKKVTRTITTVVLKKDGKPVTYLPCMSLDEVKRFYESIGGEIPEMEVKELVWECSLDGFCQIARPRDNEEN